MGWIASVPLLMAVIAFGGAGAARADESAAANRLLVEAVGLVGRAEAIESPGDRAALYERALDNLDEIAARHPESDLAVRLAAGQAVGEIDRRAFERQRRLSVAEGCIAELDHSCLLALALEMSPAIEDVGKRSWALSIIAAGQADAGAFEQALETANAATDLGDRAWALGAIAAAMANAGTGAQVREVIGDAVAAASEINNAYRRASTLGEVALWQAIAGDKSGARQTVRRAAEVAIAVDFDYGVALALAPIAEAQIMAGDAVLGRQTLVHAVERARQESVTMLRVHALSRLASVQATTGDTAGARETIGDAIGSINSFRARVVSFFGRWSRDQSFAQIVRALARTGDVDRAHEIALGIDSPYRRATAFSDIAEAQLRVGDVADARRSLELAFEAVKKIDSGSETALSVVYLLQVFQ